MNTTKQKAEAWLVKTIDVTDLSDEISRELTDAQEIITAMLKENAVLFGSAKRLVDHADWQISGTLNKDSPRELIPSRACSRVKARHLASLRNAIALCEKEHDS